MPSKKGNRTQARPAFVASYAHDKQFGNESKLTDENTRHARLVRVYEFRRPVIIRSEKFCALQMTVSSLSNRENTKAEYPHPKGAAAAPILLIRQIKRRDSAGEF